MRIIQLRDTPVDQPAVVIMDDLYDECVIKAKLKDVQYVNLLTGSVISLERSTSPKKSHKMKLKQQMSISTAMNPMRMESQMASSSWKLMVRELGIAQVTF